MTDDISAAAPRPYASRAASSAIAAPPGHAIRRSRTVDDVSASSARRRPPMGQDSYSSAQGPDAPPRRSSNFSDYNLYEARDILNPQPQDGQPSNHESSSLAPISLAFALLPALAGALFKDGSAVVTDVMLLGLAGVFLHWSVTQPWAWYHSAQVVRVQHEAEVESAIQDESDSDNPSSDQRPSSPLNDVPEEGDESSTEALPQSQTSDKKPTSQQQGALNELYRHEILALTSCFAFPLASAYLLHAIRSQLSRPSEGLVSNYNLTIFALVSELRVFSHILKLVQSRTLHLQRVVQGDASESSGRSKKLEQVLERLKRLEARSAAEEALLQQSVKSDSTRAKQEASMTRDVRNAIQPELDALNRAVRRYEKKATVLQSQTEARFSALDARLGDAIALAAAAAKNSVTHKNLLLRIFEVVTTIMLLPFQAALRIVLLPLRSIMYFFDRTKQQPTEQRNSRTSRPGKVSSHRYSGDRVPTRVMKR